jgi:peroxin-19
MRRTVLQYPAWLAEKESLLSKEDYERCERNDLPNIGTQGLMYGGGGGFRYGKQYQYFQQITAVYEAEPDNFMRLSELMQEMQETGQPPSEIVKELAPGLEFDGEGMPAMPNMVRLRCCG